MKTKEKTITIGIAFIISIGLMYVLFGCKTAEKVVSNTVKYTSGCDCEKSNSQIRQENKTERERIRQESKMKSDSLDFRLKFLKDSFNAEIKNNRIDSRVEKKEIKADRKNYSDSLDHVIKLQKLRINELEDSLKYATKNNRIDSRQETKTVKSDNSVKKKELRKSYWWLWLIIGAIVGQLIRYLLTIYFGIVKMPLNKR